MRHKVRNSNFLLHLQSQSSGLIFYSYLYLKLSLRFMVHFFRHEISGNALPAQFTDPFHYTPHALCIEAAKEVQGHLASMDLWEREPEEGKMIDPRDNHEYKIVTIGEQIWMAENLAYLPSVSKPEAAATSDGDPLYFVFNYDGEDVNAAKATKEYKTAFGGVWKFP